MSTVEQAKPWARGQRRCAKGVREGRRVSRARALRAAAFHLTALGVALGVALCVALPARARAYTYSSPLAAGCHERLTAAALRDARSAELASAWTTADDDRAWIDDLPFDLPRDARDLAAASLLVGVRDNDLKGRHGLDTSELPSVHGDPAAQAEHCLRRPEHDEPDGSAAALRDCRAFIRDTVEDALREGLDARGLPDPNARIDVDVDLAFAGRARVPMPRFYVQIGRALHTLQDSFSHAVRSEDGLRVRALLNWVDFAAEHHEPTRDGPAHRSELDACEDLDELRALRLRRANDASRELLAAALDRSRTTDARLAAVDEVLDRYMSFEPGCGVENDYCDAPELGYPESLAGCAITPGALGTAWPLFACALVALVWRVRRRAVVAGRAGVMLAIALLLAAPDSAAAQPGKAEQPPAAADDEKPIAPLPSDLALSAELGAAADQASAAATVGARYGLSDRWLLGPNIEWNPWASFDTGRVRSGTFNAYATLVFREALRLDLALRIAGHLGASILLFDLYGAPSGSVGPYFGLSLLALEFRVSPKLTMVVEPAELVIAMPHVTGVPLTRLQYRASIGLDFWL